MRPRMNALWRRVGIALLLILAVSFMGFGCASSYQGSYKLGFQGTSPRFNTSNWTIEHNFLNSAWRTDKEDWEDDSG